MLPPRIGPRPNSLLWAIVPTIYIYIYIYLYLYYLSFKGVFRIKKDEGRGDDNKWEGDRALLYAINDFDLACHLMIFFFFLILLS